MNPFTDSSDQPDVSVVMACHNAAATVTQTIESIEAQTLEHWELIAVDDGSTDDTPELLRRAAERDHRIRFVPRLHSGQPATKNAGIREASADCVMILDADDVARPNALAAMLHASNAAGDSAIVAPGYELLTQRGSPLGVCRIPAADGFSVDRLLRGNRVPPMSLVPRRLLTDAPFDESLATSIDWNLWLRLAAGGANYVTVPEILFGYRLHTGSLSHNACKLFESGCRVIEQWMTYANDPQSLRDAYHRLAVAYGTVALARGDADAIWTFFERLWPLRPTAEFARAAAESIYWAFEFVHGAEGETWQENAGPWLEQLTSWLDDGPIAPQSAEILHLLKRDLSGRTDGLARVREFLEERADATRLLVYGLGTNGTTLLEQLRGILPRTLTEIRVADDHVDSATLAARGLSPADPRDWHSWPEGTVAIVTPNECDAMVGVLQRAGGEEGIDFITVALRPAMAD